MKEIVFRPLRRVKKTGKIVVASYAQWCKIATADYGQFKLIVDDEYKALPKDEYVHNYKGELLFWWTFNPGDLPILKKEGLHFDYDAAKAKYQNFIVDNGSWTTYFVRGLDCNATPTFSHYTEDYISRPDLWEWFTREDYQPLNVETVTKWFGWFLFNLNNSYLQIGK